MKSYCSFFVLSLTLFSISTLASPLSAQQFFADAIPTSFTFTTNGEDLEVREQYMLKRAGRMSGGEAAMGYESRHLLLITNKQIMQPTLRSDFRGTSALNILFKDTDGTPFDFARIRGTQFKTAGEQTDAGPYYYEIDLSRVPLLVLRDAATIEIIRRNRPPVRLWN